MYVEKIEHNSNRKIINEMIGNIPSLNDPGVNNIYYKTHLNLYNIGNKTYPNCIYNKSFLNNLLKILIKLS